MVRSIGAALAIALAATPAGARSQRLVLVFENRSGTPGAIGLVSEGLGPVLARRGYEVIDGQEVADFQSAVHLARVDPLPAPMAGKLLMRFRADLALAVVINFVLEAAPRSRGPRANPAVGLTVRLIDGAGRVLWRNSLGILADDVRAIDRRASAIGGAVATTCERLLFALPRARASPHADEEIQVTGRRRAGGPRFPLLFPRASRVTAPAAGPRTP